MGWLPPPWVCLAIVISCGSYLQDVTDILLLSASAVIGRGGKNSGCILCNKMMGLILKVSELDELDNLDCGKLCFGGAKCSNICSRVVTAMRTSEGYPCIAAGLCPVQDEESDVQCQFSWKALRCFPETRCVRKFPARCEVNAGLKSWRRYTHVLGKNAGARMHSRDLEL